MPPSSLPTHRTLGPITCRDAVARCAASIAHRRTVALHRTQHPHDAARARRPPAHLPLQAGTAAPNDGAHTGATTVRRCPSGLRGISSSTPPATHGHAP